MNRNKSVGINKQKQSNRAVNFNDNRQNEIMRMDDYSNPFDSLFEDFGFPKFGGGRLARTG